MERKFILLILLFLSLSVNAIIYIDKTEEIHYFSLNQSGKDIFNLGCINFSEGGYFCNNTDIIPIIWNTTYNISTVNNFTITNNYTIENNYTFNSSYIDNNISQIIQNITDLRNNITKNLLLENSTMWIRQNNIITSNFSLSGGSVNITGNLFLNYGNITSPTNIRFFSNSSLYINYTMFCNNDKCDIGNFPSAGPNLLFVGDGGGLVSIGSTTGWMSIQPQTRYNSNFKLEIHNQSNKFVLYPSQDNSLELGVSNLRFKSGYIVNAWTVGDLNLAANPYYYIRIFENNNGWITIQRINKSILKSANIITGNNYTDSKPYMVNGKEDIDIKSYMENNPSKVENIDIGDLERRIKILEDKIALIK